MSGSASGERRHPWAEFLGRLEKPGRYLGGEEQQIRKPADAALACRFVLAFPDLYEIGMSHLGTRILYDQVNRWPDLACERAFTPWRDAEAELRARNLPLVSLETFTPLSRFDVVGVSLQYELSYTNVLLNLDLGGIPLRSADRGDADPIVLAGGPTATHPEPLAAFVDAFVVGEAEALLPDLLRTVGRMRRAGRPRAEVLAALSRIPGVYVPGFYRVELDPRNDLLFVAGRTAAGEAAGAPERVERAWIRDLEQFPFPDRFPVPYAEAIFDRAAVEITRGCTEGCRFCQAGMIYRPVRERDPKSVIQAVLRGIDEAGYADTSLTALSTADVSCIDPLIRELVPALAERKVSLGIASLRAYGLSEGLLDEIKRVGINGLTFAPEAGTQRMRDVINKNVSEEDILTSARRIAERGYDRMKMYFIMGLPTETEADLMGIAETAGRVRREARAAARGRPPQVTASVSQHVPKPHTPFQWAAMDGIEELRDKKSLLISACKRLGVNLKLHDERESWLECLFARGDRRMGEVLEHAYRHGARFDGWKECFSFETWLDALAALGVDPDVYTRTLPLDGRLPWDHVDIGLAPGFLADEWRKAIKARVSPPCGKPLGAKVHAKSLPEAMAEGRRLVCYDCGIACDLSAMKVERVESLRTLEDMSGERAGEEALEAAAAAAEPAAVDVPLSRLAGQLGRSNLDDDSVFKHNAEAPHSRLRVLYRKGGPLRFLGHLDLLRILPRMFRRARVELGFRRGYNPTPRMVFAPALPLGHAADEDVVDVDVILDESSADMAGMLEPEARAHLGESLRTRLSAAAPPGLEILGARLCEPGERRLPELVAGADFAVELDTDDAVMVAARLPGLLERDTLVIERGARPRKKRRRGRPEDALPTVVDVRPAIVQAHVDRQSGLLRFRLRIGPEGGVRPREAAEALIGRRVDDHRFVRERLLTFEHEGWVALSALGPRFRPRSSPRPSGDDAAAIP